MIVSTGVDTADIERIRRLARDNARFRARVFTETEVGDLAGRPDPGPGFAARFAAKEAVMKCLGTGWSEGVGFRQVEVVRTESGAPRVVLHGVARAKATELGITRIHLSMSHGPRDAVAFAVAEA